MNDFNFPYVPAGNRLKIFSLCLDFAAAMRARWVAGSITQIAGDSWSCSTESWKLESLRTAFSVRKMITEEAEQADVILLAITSLDRKEFELIEWLGSLTPVPTTARPTGLLIGLFGDDSPRSLELDWTVKRCMSCAQAINRDFIWHWMEEAAAGEPEWLTSHIETHLARKMSAQDPHAHFAELAEAS